VASPSEQSIGQTISHYRIFEKVRGGGGVVYARGGIRRGPAKIIGLWRPHTEKESVQMMKPAPVLMRVAAGVYRICTPRDVIPGGFTFNSYLLADDEPLLFHTGYRKLFPVTLEVIGKVMQVENLR